MKTILSAILTLSLLTGGVAFASSKNGSGGKSHSSSSKKHSTGGKHRSSTNHSGSNKTRGNVPSN